MIIIYNNYINGNANNRIDEAELNSILNLEDDLNNAYSFTCDIS
jgi:hypothetical protein